VRRLALPVSAAASAFAAHALVYGTLRPADPTHAYFAWYGRVCLAALAVLVVLAALGRRPSSLPAAPGVRALTASTFVFLLVQESVEQHRLVTQTPSQLLLMLTAVTVASLLLSYGLRAIRAVVAPQPVRPAYGLRGGWIPVASLVPAPNPVAGAVSLRGPPAR